MLDALLYHQSEVPVGRHHTDGGGDSDHVFALCSLLGFQFAPRIPDLKHRRLYSSGKPSEYPTLEPMIAGRTNLALIRAHWKAILRIVPSSRTGTYPPGEHRLVGWNLGGDLNSARTSAAKIRGRLDGDHHRG